MIIIIKRQYNHNIKMILVMEKQYNQTKNAKFKSYNYIICMQVTEFSCFKVLNRTFVNNNGFYDIIHRCE